MKKKTSKFDLFLFSFDFRDLSTNNLVEVPSCVLSKSENIIAL